MKKTFASAIAVCLGFCAPAWAEPARVTIGIQNGIAYLPLQVLAAQHLVEKHAKALGVTLAADVRNLGQAGFVRDALIAGQIQFGVAGTPTLITLYDKTHEFKAMLGVSGIPMVLNTTNPKIKTVCDFAAGDKIALPTVKSSSQAVILQMASKAECGNAFRNDAYTVTMSHPDAYNALLTNVISAHMAAPPYGGLEIKNGKGKVRQILNADDVMHTKSTTVFVLASDKFRVANPKAYRAVFDAVEEGQAFVRDHPAEAAAIYIKAENSRETPADIVTQISPPNATYDSTPQGVGLFAAFMNEIGTIKTKYTWQQLTMPEMQARKGS